jgi:hypothetical protein
MLADIGTPCTVNFVHLSLVGAVAFPVVLEYGI